MLAHPQYLDQHQPYSGNLRHHLRNLRRHRHEGQKTSLTVGGSKLLDNTKVLDLN